MDKIELIVSLLEGVAKGAIEADVALEQWPNIDDESDDLVADSWHDLSHFSADADIREKDSEYADYQVALLRDKANQIKVKYAR